MPETFLSIIITTYKRNEWLKECLDSLSNSIAAYQLKGGIKKIEIVISDDDPEQDQTILEPHKLLFENMCVKLIHSINQANLGDYFNRNNGIKASVGKWVKFVDDDDLVYSWSISFMIDKLEESTNANTVIFYLRDGFRNLKFPLELKQQEIFDFHYIKYGLFHCSLVSAAFLRKDLVEVGLFKFKRFYGDFQIFHDMALNGLFKIYPIELGWYRVHEMQESNFNRQNAHIVFNYHLFSFDFIKQNRLGNKYLHAICNYCLPTIKYAVRTADLSLLRKAAYLLLVINAEIFSWESVKLRASYKWKSYYSKQMQFNNNEVNYAPEATPDIPHNSQAPSNFYAKNSSS